MKTPHNETSLKVRSVASSDSIGNHRQVYLVYQKPEGSARIASVFRGRRPEFSVKMSVSSGTSFVLSAILTVLIFSGMQMYRGWLGSSQLYTILGGYIGSMLFICVLTAIGNLETTVFGKSFQQKLFPEVVFALVVSLIASGLVHRVATTTCFLFSMVALYYMNRISQQTYVPVPTVQTYTKKRK